MAKASGGIDLQAYNKASQEATNYLSFDSQTGLTIGQANLNSKVNISSGGIKLYDEGGNVKTNISSQYSTFGDENAIHVRVDSLGMKVYGGNNGEELYAEFSSFANIYGGYGDLHIDSDDLTFSRDGVEVTKFETHVNNITMPIVTANVSGYYPTPFYTVSFDSPSYYGFEPERVNYKNPSGINFIKIPRQDEWTDETLFYTFEEGVLKIYKASSTSTISGTISIAITLINRQYTARGVIGSFEDTTYNGSMLKVANGESATNRSNAFNVLSDGDVRIKGDMYVGCNGDSTGGRKLVSASVDGGSGTKSNVATGTTLKNLTSVTLSDPGVYMFLGLARFPANANGRRGLAWGSTSTGYFDNSLVVVPPVTESNGITRIQSIAIVTVASSLSVYLNCYHTAGTPLNIEYYWRYIKLA